MRITIMEDNQDRRDGMLSVLGDLAPNVPVEFFASSYEMIEHLDQSGLKDILLISLDNDLELLEGNDGQLIDPGDGVAVARWLAPKVPKRPIIIHTTNTIAGDQMEQLLNSHQWDFQRVVPYGGEDWIFERWRLVVRGMLEPHR